MKTGFNFKYWKRFIPVLVAVLFIVALRIFYNEIRGMTFSELRASFAGISRMRLFLSVSAVALSYWLTTLIENYAVRDNGVKMSYMKVARVSFISNAVGSSIGVPALSGASFRLRYYSRCGAKPSQVARIIAVTQLSGLVGAAGLNGLVLLFWPRDIIALIRFPSVLRWFLTFICLALPLLFLFMSKVVKDGRDITIYGYQIPVPDLKTMTRQLAAGFCGPPSASMVLYFLLPASHGISFPIFCGTFALSSIAGGLSMVPAGFGVFEVTLLWALRHFYSSTELLSALLLYRLLFNLMPFIIAGALLIYDVFKPSRC